MKLYFSTAYKYIRFYSGRSISIVLSMVLSIALMVGIGTLSTSARESELNQTICEDGSYHTKYNGISQKQYEELANDEGQFALGVKQYYDSSSKDRLNLVCADDMFLKMNNCEIIEGRIPQSDGEIALEAWVLSNLYTNIKVGEKITIDLYDRQVPKTYTLVGILDDRIENKKSDIMEGFLSTKCVDKTRSVDAYVQFYSNTNIESQILSVQNAYSINEECTKKNNVLIDAINATKTIDINIICVMLIIAFFVAMVIYSIFNISVMQRLSEYGTLEAIGAKLNQIFKFIICELLLLSCISMPIGIGLGILEAKVFSKFAGQLFTEGDIVIQKISISEVAIFLAILVLIIIITSISFIIIKKLKSITPMNAINKSFGAIKVDKIVKSNHFFDKMMITNVITIKNILKNKRVFFTTTVTMALGGIVFIVATYSANLQKTDIQENLKLDTSLSSDFKIYSGMFDSQEAVSESQLNLIQNIEGIQSVRGIQVKYGGIILQDNQILNKDFFERINNNEYNKNALNGVFTKDTNGEQYLLKSCIYGYGEQSLNELDSYLLEGKIELDEMNQEQTVILHMAVDGLNNPQLDFKVGDKIKIRFLENTEIDENSVKMPDNLNYIEKEFVIGGIVSQIKDKYDDYGNGEADIIFSSQAFNDIMGYENTSLISANASENANHTKIVNQISKIVEDVPTCSVRDMSAQVNEMKSYINQKLSFIYAITIILLIIGLFNIMNNISYTLLSRTTEFGIMQAIGLGYGDLRKLIMKEGIIYSFISCIITLIGSFLGQFILFILKKNSYMGAQFTINVEQYIIAIILNILIGGIATYIPSKKLHKCSIIQSINRLE